MEREHKIEILQKVNTNKDKPFVLDYLETVIKIDNEVVMEFKSYKKFSTNLKGQAKIAESIDELILLLDNKGQRRHNSTSNRCNSISLLRKTWFKIINFFK